MTGLSTALRRVTPFLALALVLAWLGALAAGASFAYDLGYACAALAVGTWVVERRPRPRRSR